jgi:hypothetical protein
MATFPSGAITPCAHPSAWTGEAMRGSSDWIVGLTAAHNAELRDAMRAAQARGLAIPSLGAADFPLPGLAPVLQHIRDAVVDGRGFVLLRGLEIADLSAADAAFLYWGIGAHMGRGRAQNGQGEVLGHVTDLGVDFRTNPNARGYQSRLKLAFHNDLMDIVGLLCLMPAKAGGASRIVSSTAVHNAVLAQRPDLIATMYQPFAMDRRGEAPAGRKPWYWGALFERAGERLFCRYNRTYIESAQRFPELPRLTAEQTACLDLMDTLVEDPALCLDMELQRGDMQFISNYTVLHSRTAYEDWPDPARRRYLLRLWLETGLVERMPPSWAERYEDMDLWQRTPMAPVFDLSARRNDLIH